MAAQQADSLEWRVWHLLKTHRATWSNLFCTGTYTMLSTKMQMPSSSALSYMINIC